MVESFFRVILAAVIAAEVCGEPHAQSRANMFPPFKSEVSWLEADRKTEDATRDVDFAEFSSQESHSTGPKEPIPPTVERGPPRLQSSGTNNFPQEEKYVEIREGFGVPESTYKITSGGSFASSAGPNIYEQPASAPSKSPRVSSKFDEFSGENEFLRNEDTTNLAKNSWNGITANSGEWNADEVWGKANGAISTGWNLASGGAGGGWGSSGSGGNAGWDGGGARDSDLAPIIKKSVYVHIAPDDDEPVRPKVIVPKVAPRKNYQIVFIKSPSPPTLVQPIIPPYPVQQDKTLIYVLHPKPEEAPPIELPAPPENVADKPEVYFVKYKAKKDRVPALADGKFGPDRRRRYRLDANSRINLPLQSPYEEADVPNVQREVESDNANANGGSGEQRDGGNEVAGNGGGSEEREATPEEQRLSGEVNEDA